MPSTKPKIAPTLKPSSRADLDRKRKGVVATGPSGAVYRIRKPNLERHVQAGGMTQRLKHAAVDAMRKVPDGSAGAQDLAVEQLEELERDLRDFDDRLVLATVIEPTLMPEDLGTGELDDDPLLPAVDYSWLVNVAHGRVWADGQGRRLWGPAPLDLWDVWREAHSCDAECVSCVEAVEVLTVQVAS